MQFLSFFGLLGNGGDESKMIILLVLGLLLIPIIKEIKKTYGIAGIILAIIIFIIAEIFGRVTGVLK